jgi:SAM-dependent methyltransferase
MFSCASQNQEKRIVMPSSNPERDISAGTTAITAGRGISAVSPATRGARASSAGTTATSSGKAIVYERVLRKLQCTFLPWTVLRPLWGPATRAYWEAYPTSHFQELSETCHTLLQEVMRVAPDLNTSILDMGCNVGRHLNHLHERGYRNLRGVDFSSTAIAQMATRYPQMRATSEIYQMSFQRFLRSIDDPVDVAYTRGATFELVHPSFPLIERLCAKVRRHIVLALQESAHYYPRCWEYEFARQGFELTRLWRQVPHHLPRTKIITLFTFERMTDL